MSQNAGSYFSKILKLFFPKGTCPRIQLREHVALQNAMLAMQGLFKSATNPVQIIHIPTFFFLLSIATKASVPWKAGD